MGSHARQVLIALVGILSAALICQPAAAQTGPNILSISGSITGTVNGGPILGTTSGTIDTGGYYGGSMIGQYSEFPSSFSPIGIRNSLCTYWVVSALADGDPLAKNMFALTGGNYAENITYIYPFNSNYSTSSINVSASSTTTGNQANYSLNASGYYAAPTDLLGASNVKFSWTQASNQEIDECGSATLTASDNSTFPVYWFNTYTFSNSGSGLPSAESAVVKYSLQSWNGTTHQVAYSGVISSTTTGLWSGSTSSYYWSSSASWAGTSPSASSSLEFGYPQSGYTGNYNDFYPYTQFNGITFLSGAPAYTLTGNPIALGAGVVNQSGTNQTIALDVALVPGAGGVFNTGSSNITVSGAVSGSGALGKNGNGTLILTGTNTYSGGTVVSGGTLQGDSNSLQGSFINNSTMVFNQTANGTFGGTISGNGTVVKNGSGTLYFQSPLYNPLVPPIEYIINYGSLNFYSPYPYYPNRVHSFQVYYPGELDLSGDTMQTGSLIGTGIVSLGGTTQPGSLTVSATNNSSTTFSGKLVCAGGSELVRQ